MATLKEVSTILIKLADAYGAEVSPAMAKNYHAVLGEYPRIVLVRAANSVMREQKFFPRVAELVHHAEKHRKKYSAPIKDWEKIDEATFWLMYSKGYVDPNEITNEDMRMIYQDARVEYFA